MCEKKIHFTKFSLNIFFLKKKLKKKNLSQDFRGASVQCVDLQYPVGTERETELGARRCRNA